MWGEDCAYPSSVGGRTWGGPKPETAQDAADDGNKNFMDKAKAAFDKGVWQTYASLHARYKVVDPESLKGGTTVVQAKPGKTTLRMAYFFSGIQRKASIAEQLKKRCEKEGIGLVVFEIDVVIGGSQHDQLDRESQDQWLARLEDGDFDVIMLSPPCGSWSRSNWATDDGPKPCRDRKNPWGIS